jgi:adenine nucleotide transporter 17
MTVFFPLETARTRLQVDEDRRATSTAAALADIVKEEGWTALYRGIGPVLTSVCCSNFVYFYTVYGLKAALRSHGIEISALKDLLMASIAGAVNVVTTTPLWVVNMRLKLQGAKFKSQTGTAATRQGRHYTGILDGLVKITSEEGITSLWSSTIASLMLVSNPSIQFMVYEKLKRVCKRRYKTVGKPKSCK